MKHIILASTSPRRKQIMDTLGIPYQQVASNYEERNEEYTDPAQLVETFAREKAADVLNRYPDAIVIGGDTVVFDAAGKIMGKAKDRADAFAMMQRLQGRTAKIYTGSAVLSEHIEKVGHVQSGVQFKPMTDEKIEEYLDHPEADWMDKAGAFAVQGRAGEWIEQTNGEWEAILGMSVELTRKLLKEHGLSI